MSEATMSAHATVRAQQRGVRRPVIELLLTEGERIAARGGALKIYLSARVRRRLRRRAACGSLAAADLDRAMGTYLVITRGTPHIITIGHIGKRGIRRR